LRRTAWARHSKCESDTAALCKANRKTHSKPLAVGHSRGTSLARHAVCESAFADRSFVVCVGCYKKTRNDNLVHIPCHSCLASNLVFEIRPDITWSGKRES